MLAHTVSQIPESQAAHFVARAANALPPVIDQLYEAADASARARQLLRLSDDLVLRYLPALKQACDESDFRLGSAFLDVRAAAAMAVRDREGRLPGHIADTLEIWRAGLVAVAGGLRS